MENERFKGYILFEKFRKTELIESYRGVMPSANPAHDQIDLLNTQLSSNAKFCNILSEHMEKIKRNTDLQGIFKIKESGTFDDHFYVVKDYKKAKSLKDIITESNEQYFPINLDHSVYIVRQLSAFFQYILANVDKGTVLYFIDPEDIIITFEGEIFQDNLYLADAITQTFGKSIPRFGNSVSYFAPEYISKGIISEKNIIFSLGAVFYEILSNKRLMPDNIDEFKKSLDSFSYPEESDFEETIDQQLLDILTKMIQIDPDERYEDLNALQADLDEYIEEGDFSPTTFHFVFFLETLFREYTEKLPKVMEQEIEEAKHLELEAIRESEEEMLQQKMEETKKESKFPVLPVVIVLLFIGLIIVGLTLPRAWKDEAEAMLEEKKKELEKAQTYDQTEPAEVPAEVDTEPAEPDEDSGQTEPVVTEPPVQPEDITEEPPVQDDAEQRRLEAERAERERIERERREQERLAQEQAEKDQAEKDRLDREEKQKLERIDNLVQTAQSQIADKNIDEAKKSVSSILEIDPENEKANDLSIEIDKIERDLSKQRRAELVKIPINISEADTEPTLINSPRIDLRQVEGRIPRDILRDLKNRVNRITVRMLVSENGDVESVEEIFVQKSVYGTFERTGLIAEIDKQIRSAKYTPAIKDGMKRKCYVTLTFPWN